MERGTWQAIVCGVAKVLKRLSNCVATCKFTVLSSWKSSVRLPVKLRSPPLEVRQARQDALPDEAWKWTLMSR